MGSASSFILTTLTIPDEDRNNYLKAKEAIEQYIRPRVNEVFELEMKFPNCMGCTDDKHIRIKVPPKSGSMFYNYKHFFCIVLHAVAAQDYTFVAVDIGAYCKESDGGIFASSNLFRQLQNGALKTNLKKCLPGSDITLPHIIIGDDAYILKPYPMRLYPARNLGFEEEIYNKCLTTARQVAVCAIDIMTSKQHLLTKVTDINPKRADCIITVHMFST
ncbi:hypothetical protein PR048_025975 [Dryococelus australis]|uniref:DDE Tnp4 domain-containing protein n=1 Tax=Dryococelus australis TaxID=614101 RepID=A0ABQ9GK11_9NEOP|nr:hypothetical protein PR048_025975 [Dryococelus australis]